MSLLFLNSIGTGEVVFILMIILMLFGSKSIPGIAKGLGKGMREIRDASNEIKRDIQNSALEMRNDLNSDETLKGLTDLDLDLDEDGEIASIEHDLTVEDAVEYKKDNNDSEYKKEESAEDKGDEDDLVTEKRGEA